MRTENNAEDNGTSDSMRAFLDECEATWSASMLTILLLVTIPLLLMMIWPALSLVMATGIAGVTVLVIPIGANIIKECNAFIHRKASTHANHQDAGEEAALAQRSRDNDLSDHTEAVTFSIIRSVLWFISAVSLVTLLAPTMVPVFVIGIASFSAVTRQVLDSALRWLVSDARKESRRESRRHERATEQCEGTNTRTITNELTLNQRSSAKPLTVPTVVEAEVKRESRPQATVVPFVPAPTPAPVTASPTVRRSSR